MSTNHLAIARMGDHALTTVWSAGWRTDVALGSGQADVYAVLRTIADQNPSHTWHDAPRVRDFGGRLPGNVSRLLHRLAALGVIALDVTRGRNGGIRFTFRVRRWKRRAPVRHVLTLARMLRSAMARVRAAVTPSTIARAHAENRDPPDPIAERLDRLTEQLGKLIETLNAKPPAPEPFTVVHSRRVPEPAPPMPVVRDHSGFGECVLCGYYAHAKPIGDADGLAMGLTYRGGQYGYGLRCRNHEACAERSKPLGRRS